MNFLKQLFSKYKKEKIIIFDLGNIKHEPFKGFSYTVEEGQRMAKAGHYAEIPDPDKEFKN